MPFIAEEPAAPGGGPAAPPIDVAAPWWKAVAEGTVATFVLVTVNLAYSLSFAAVIFSGQLSGGLGFGISAALIGAALTGVVVAARSSFPLAVAGPDTPVIAVLGSLAALTAATTTAADPIPAVMAVIALTSLLIGIALWLCGAARISRVLRFVPFPVLAAFIAASGWFLIAAAAAMVLDGAARESDAATGLGAATLVAPVVAVAVALAIAAGRAWWRAPWALPIVVVVATMSFHIGLAASGITMEAAGERGWLLRVDASTSGVSPGAMFSSELLNPVLLATIWPDIVVVVGVAMIVLFLNASSLELSLEADADLDREFRTGGVANVLVAFGGGLPGGLSLSRTVLHARCGATGRASGLLAAVVCALPLAAGTAWAALLPSAVLAGVVLYLGSSLLWLWLIKNRRALPLADHLLLVAVFAAIVAFGYLPGVAIGIVAACVAFALGYAHVPVIGRHLTRTSCTSCVSRRQEADRLLLQNGQRIHLLRLQGFVFFGAITALADRIRSIAIEAPPATRAHWVVLDFALVTGVDSSALQCLRRLVQLADGEPRFVLALAAVPRPVARRIAAFDGPRPRLRHFATADAALEHCEDELLAAAGLRLEPAASTLEEWLATDLGDRDAAARLASHCQRLDLQPGAMLCRQGERADAIYLLLRGRLTVLLEPEAPDTRLRTMESQTVVGEMGFFRGAVRTASVRADQPSLVYAIDRATIEMLKSTDPPAVVAFQGLVIRTLADRLASANGELSARQR
ncbi:MAG: SulP family inorganic anion transporter [Pseudomonadota bacterium]